MPLICKSCPNKTNFNRIASGTVNWSAGQDVDENEDVIDDHDYEYDDYDTQDTSSLTCSDCSSEDVDDVDQEEWDNWEGPESDDPENGTWKNKLLRNK